MAKWKTKIFRAMLQLQVCCCLLVKLFQHAKPRELSRARNTRNAHRNGVHRPVCQWANLLSIGDDYFVWCGGEPRLDPKKKYMLKVSFLLCYDLTYFKKVPIFTCRHPSAHYCFKLHKIIQWTSTTAEKKPRYCSGTCLDCIRQGEYRHKDT